MERKMVSEKELLSYLNQELQKIGQLENYRFNAIVRMKIEYRSGCNWASATIQSCEGKEAACPLAAERIVDEAKARFNVK